MAEIPKEWQKKQESKIPEEWEEWYRKEAAQQKKEAARIDLSPKIKNILKNTGKIISSTFLILIFIFIILLNITIMTRIDYIKKTAYADKQNTPVSTTEIILEADKDGIFLVNNNQETLNVLTRIKVNGGTPKTGHKVYLSGKCPESITLPFIPLRDFTYNIRLKTPAILDGKEYSNQTLVVNEVPETFMIIYKEVMFKC